MGNDRNKNKKNITTMVLVSLALFIYMLILGTFIPTRPGSIFPTAIGATIGFIAFYVTFGGKFERLLNKIVSIFFGLPIAGLFVGIAKYIKVEVTLPMFIVFLAVGVCISVALFGLIEKKTDRKRVETAYKTDERGAILNDKSATVGFIALSLFLLAYLIKDYLEAGIFDKILLLTLCGGWIVLIFARLYYEWRM
ncbi:MAG: hypothetical protein J7K81_00280 [Methanophagales archaeon]|nr:hypothetical protein [Methanophagales archaeon]